MADPVEKQGVAIGGVAAGQLLSSPGNIIELHGPVKVGPLAKYSAVLPTGVVHDPVSHYRYEHMWLKDEFGQEFALGFWIDDSKNLVQAMDEMGAEYMKMQALRRTYGPEINHMLKKAKK